MSKTYAVHSIFDTIQGEGWRAGRRSVFVRFAGCNVWDGRPAHRDKGTGACAQWCDTNFFRGQKMTADEIAQRCLELWPKDGSGSNRWVTVTGGEPMLQFDVEVVNALHRAEFFIEVETNGSVPAIGGNRAEFVGVRYTLSPKIGVPVALEAQYVSALKVVLPGHIDFDKGWADEDLLKLRRKHALVSQLYVQPQDPTVREFVEVSHLHKNLSAYSYANTAQAEQAMRAEYERNLKRCVAFVMAHPEWALSLQQHKFAGLP